MREAQEQENLFTMLAYVGRKYPEAQLLFHVPNGGKRNAAEAAHLKKQGVKAGVPDLFLPVARGGFHGLFIEMKVGKNKPTGNQKKWMEELAKQGYAVRVCYGSKQGYESILEYLKMKER